MLLILQAVFIGTLATLFMDLMTWCRKRFFKITALNYALVGRWMLCWKQGVFRHKNILQSPQQKYEHISGWLIHYLLGIVWAYLYLLINNLFAFEYLLLSILIFALLTTLAPLMLMQPALGFGFFASRTPHPSKSIQNSLITHLIFGFGLYFAYLIFFKLVIRY